MKKKGILLILSIVMCITSPQANYAMAAPTVHTNKSGKIEINLDGNLANTNLATLIAPAKEKDVVSLSLKNNNLLQISPSLKSFIKKFTNLESLYLGGQNLSWLEDDLLDNTQSLKTVGLSNNLFIDLPNSVKKKGNSLNKIIFAGNPVAYDTYMKWDTNIKRITTINQPAQLKRHLSILSGISAVGFRSLADLYKDLQVYFNAQATPIKSTDPNHWHLTLANYLIYPKSGLTAAQESTLKSNLDTAMRNATAQAIQEMINRNKPNNIRLDYSDTVQILNKFVVAIFKDTHDARLLIKKVQSYFLENISSLIKNGDIVQIYNPYPDFKAHVSIGVEINNNPLPNQLATINTKPLSNVMVRDFIISKPDNIVLSHWRN